MTDALDEPLSLPTARALIRDILATGITEFSKHAKQEMDNDRLTPVDCVNVLRRGVVEQADWERGSWRYRVRAARITVVVFRSAGHLVVVTAWRKQ